MGLLQKWFYLCYIKMTLRYISFVSVGDFCNICNGFIKQTALFRWYLNVQQSLYIIKCRELTNVHCFVVFFKPIYFLHGKIIKQSIYLK